MRVHDDYKSWNIAAQMKNADSAWRFWQAMLKVRKAHPALIYGASKSSVIHPLAYVPFCCLVLLCVSCFSSSSFSIC
jgi:hypothetical protein